MEPVELREEQLFALGAGEDTLCVMQDQEDKASNCCSLPLNPTMRMYALQYLHHITTYLQDSTRRDVWFLAVSLLDQLGSQVLPAGSSSPDELRVVCLALTIIAIKFLLTRPDLKDFLDSGVAHIRSQDNDGSSAVLLPELLVKETQLLSLLRHNVLRPTASTWAQLFATRMKSLVQEEHFPAVESIAKSAILEVGQMMVVCQPEPGKAYALLPPRRLVASVFMIHFDSVAQSIPGLDLRWATGVETKSEDLVVAYRGLATLEAMRIQCRNRAEMRTSHLLV